MVQTALARKISLPLLTFYGLGTILGAGIYVLIGEVTLRAGLLSPLSFILSAIIAAMTAYSFARLSSMYPKSAGPAAYAQAAFESKWISVLIGLSVVLIGTVSAATMVKGFAGYFIELVSMQETIVMFCVILVISAISSWGIGQSLMVAAVITIIEVAGLLFVIGVLINPGELATISLPTSVDFVSAIPVLFFAAFISFYAYIGFEDIVNIAEETINPTRVVPLAILFSLILSTALYVLLSIACTIFIPMSVFENSQAPLASIVEHEGFDPTIMILVSVIAIINGALVQQIMAARVLYGMARQGLFLSIFGVVNSKTKTPIFATIIIGVFILFLAMTLDLVTLAEITSAITLIIFMVVQASLLTIAYRSESANKADKVVPIVGILLNGLLLYFGFAHSAQ